MINDFVVFLLAARQCEQVPIALTRSVGSGPGHQVSYRRFWENRRTPDSLPTKPRALITNLLSLIPFSVHLMISGTRPSCLSAKATKDDQP